MSRVFPAGRALRTFEAAARHLNFSRAADELGLTPAAVSYQIKDIEAQLGAVRAHQPQHPADAGGRGAGRRRRRCAGRPAPRHRPRRLARGQQAAPVGRALRHELAAAAPAALRAAHPQWELSFDISDELRDFDAHDLDAAIRYGAGRYPGVVTHRLFSTVVVPVCSPRLLEAGPAPRQPRDLAAHTLCYVDCRPGGVVWPNWALWMAAAGVPDFDDSGCVAFTESSHVAQAVMDGGAVGLVERELVARELAEGRLVQLFDVGVTAGGDPPITWPIPNGANAPGGGAARWMLAELRPDA